MNKGKIEEIGTAEEIYNTQIAPMQAYRLHTQKGLVKVLIN